MNSTAPKSTRKHKQKTQSFKENISCEIKEGAGNVPGYKSLELGIRSAKTGRTEGLTVYVTKLVRIPKKHPLCNCKDSVAKTFLQQ